MPGYTGNRGSTCSQPNVLALAAVSAALGLAPGGCAAAGRQQNAQDAVDLAGELDAAGQLQVLRRAGRQADRRRAQDRSARGRADRAAVRGARRLAQEGDRWRALHLLLLGRQEQGRDAVLVDAGRHRRHGPDRLHRLALRGRRARPVVGVLPEGAQAQPHRVSRSCRQARRRSAGSSGRSRTSPISRA